jgi:hypothetical protein
MKISVSRKERSRLGLSWRPLPSLVPPVSAPIPGAPVAAAPIAGCVVIVPGHCRCRWVGRTRRHDNNGRSRRRRCRISWSSVSRGCVSIGRRRQVGDWSRIIVERSGSRVAVCWSRVTVERNRSSVVIVTQELGPMRRPLKAPKRLLQERELYSSPISLALLCGKIYVRAFSEQRRKPS